MATEAEFVVEPGADGAHITFCRLCEAQCGLIVQVTDGLISKVGPDRAHPVSEGHLCVKAAGMASITHDPDRVLTPLKRVGGPGEFAPVSWDEALNDIASRLGPIVARDGGEAVGMYVGNPASFSALHYSYAGMFAASLGAGVKFFNALHIDTGAKNMGQELVFGSPAEWTFPDLEDCDFLLMLGANPMVSHMSVVSEPRALHKLAAIHARGGVVVVDPRRTETAARFEHVPVKPDSDVWLLAAMLGHIFAAGLDDRKLLEERTTGWQEFRDAVLPITPELASSRCGVAPDMIRHLAERFCRARTSACYGRVGTNRGRFSTLVNVLIESLNVVAGRFGVSGGWVSGISPIADPQAKPPYPTHDAARSRIGNLPMILGFTPGGTLAREITTEGPGQIKILLVDCGNPVHSYPRGDLTAAALETLDLFVSIDLYVTETSRHADYILPAATFYERTDFTDMWVANAPRPWVQYTDAVIEPRGEARVEYDIYNALLARLGLPALFAGLGIEGKPQPGLMDVVDTLFRAGIYGDKFGANPDGLSIERLKQNFPRGARVADRVDAAASWTRVRTDDGRVRLWHPVTASEFSRLRAEPDLDQRDMLYLFGRRKLASLNSWMHNAERLVRSDRPALLMHPDDARDRQITDGQQVVIATSAASLTVQVEISDEVLAGSVNYPHGWGHKGGWSIATGLPGANINMLMSARPEDWEQVSGMVHIDGVAVTVVPA